MLEFWEVVPLSRSMYEFLLEINQACFYYNGISLSLMKNVSIHAVPTKYLLVRYFGYICLIVISYVKILCSSLIVTIFIYNDSSIPETEHTHLIILSPKLS